MDNNFTFQLKEAKRSAVPGLFSLWGPQGSGKTLSALLLARGLVGPTGKIGLMDTENERALFYAGREDVGPWFHCDIQPPFTPDKYSAAFKYLEDQKMDVIIVDSGSHVWSGEGGVLDQADNAVSRTGREMQGLAKWKAPKIAHKRMMNNLTRSPIPVIFCLRAKQGVKQVGKGSDMELIDIGWQPVCEKNMPYEMTLDLRMTKDGHYDLTQSKTIPDGLRDAIPEGGVVNVEMGAKIAAWCGSGISTDPEYIKLKRDGSDAATKGVDAYKAWLAKLGEEQKKKIKSHHATWSSEAKKADSDAAVAAKASEKIADAGGDDLSVDEEEIPA